MPYSKWKSVPAEELPSSVKTYLDYMCYLADVDCCADYVIKLNKRLQMTAVKSVLHQLDSEDGIEFLQRYLATAPADESNRLQKIHLQFELAICLRRAKRMEFVKQVYEGINRQLDKDSSLQGIKILRLRVQIEDMFLRLNDKSFKNRPDPDEPIHDEYRVLKAELEEWLLDTREKTAFEKYYAFVSLTSWIEVERLIRKELDREHLMEMSKWVQQLEDVAPSRECNVVLLGIYAHQLSDLYLYEGEDPAEEIKNCVQKFACMFKSICSELRLIEPEHMYIAREVSKQVQHFVHVVVQRKFPQQKDPHVDLETVAEMVRTTLRLAKLALGAEDDIVESLFLLSLHIMTDEERQKYEDLKMLVAEKVGKMPKKGEQSGQA